MSIERQNWYLADPYRETLRIRSTVRPEVSDTVTAADVDALHDLLEESSQPGGLGYPEASRQVQAKVAALDTASLEVLYQQLVTSHEVSEGTGHLSDLEVIIRRELDSRQAIK